MLTVVPDPAGRDGAGSSLIDEIVRESARRMLAEALAAEVDTYIAAFADLRGADGRRLVVRNGYHQPREVLTSAGAVEVTAPRVNDKRADPVTGQRQRFSSAISWFTSSWRRLVSRLTGVMILTAVVTGGLVASLVSTYVSASVTPSRWQVARSAVVQVITRYLFRLSPPTFT